MAFIEIDDKKIAVREGQMIIEVADELGIRIPRFCYHKKLSIAANCRMCLVEVVNAPKPLPACATPVTDGMKVHTRSQRAIDAQKWVMEFLLINHPLDCPICDQGGQCELQDVALEYGKDNSEYVEGKRAVRDQDLGPLISTDMTRCIHCTRCVRFGAEIAGVRELGATGRGEFMEIGTYVQQSVDSEISGNVIDLCPVGALTSKPFRFQARAWELQAQPSISLHDCLGSHLFFHVQNNKVLRALPREKEHLNEVWLSDRDRFSYEGLNHPDRIKEPLIKRDGHWETVDWPLALQFAVDKLKRIQESVGPSQIGVLASPNSTVEEFYLLQKLFRSVQCHNIDHRLRHIDYRHQDFLASHPSLGIVLEDLECQQAVILIGSDIRKEQPLIAARLRKTALHGGSIYAINPWGSEFNFPATQVIAQNGDSVQPLYELIKAISMVLDQPSLKEMTPILDTITPSAQVVEHALKLVACEKVSVLLGSLASSHPNASEIYYLSRLLAQLLNATWGVMSEGANSAGGWLAGGVPHRLPFAQTNPNKGLNANEMWQDPLAAYLLLHCEPEYDCALPGLAKAALKKAQAVVVLSAFDNPHFREYADVILPITPLSESAGTYVNALGQWQTVKPAVMPLGQSRPAWKVLRVMANLWNIAGFNYESVEQVLLEVESMRPNEVLDLDQNNLGPPSTPSFSPIHHADNVSAGNFVRLAPVPLYAVDGIVRRAFALQQTKDAQANVVKINSQQARLLNLSTGQKVWVKQEKGQSTVALPVVIDDKIPNGAAWVAAGIEETHTLGAPYGLIALIPA